MAIDKRYAIGGLLLGGAVGYFLWMRRASARPTVSTAPAGQLSTGALNIAQDFRSYWFKTAPFYGNPTPGQKCSSWLGMKPDSKIAVIRNWYQRRILFAGLTMAYADSSLPGWDRSVSDFMDARCAEATPIPPVRPAAQLYPAAQPQSRPAAQAIPMSQFREPTDEQIASFIAGFTDCDRWLRMNPIQQIEAAARWQGKRFAPAFVARANAYCNRVAAATGGRQRAMAKAPAGCAGGW